VKCLRPGLQRLQRVESRTARVRHIGENWKCPYEIWIGDSCKTMAIHGCSRIVAFRYAARENVSCPAGDLRELSQLDATLVPKYVAAKLPFATGRNGSESASSEPYAKR
jgi:hypothetical protein